MAEHHGSGPEEPGGSTGPVIRDKRRVDPVTGAVRTPGDASSAQPSGFDAHTKHDEHRSSGSERPRAADASGAPDVSEPERANAGPGSDSSGEPSGAADGTDAHPDSVLAAERLVDLQRLQAEYVNYKRRVDRDRELHRDVAVSIVIEALLPVLDDLHLARVHGDLEGTPFVAIADKLDGTLAKFGVERFGEPGETFDPAHHEALMHIQAELAEGTEATTVVQVLQPGYRIGDRLIRAARVAVADPP